jgi:cytochrome c biogenesis protein CcmG/thiol:disulfide interchange protein DsbE
VSCTNTRSIGLARALAGAPPQMAPDDGGRRRATFGYVTSPDSSAGRPPAEPAITDPADAGTAAASPAGATSAEAGPARATSAGAGPGAGTRADELAAADDVSAGAAGAKPGAAGPGRRTGRRVRLVALVVTALAGLAVIGLLTVAVADAGTGPATRPAAPKRPAAAQPFALAALGHAGQQVTLSRYAGQPVIVNFFASWCGPCQHETPLLAGFYAAHHGQVQVIGIDSNDTTAAALRFVQSEHVGYPVGADPFPAKTATSYGVLALPQTFFLNARHQIVRHIVGQVTAKELAAWAAQLG